MKKITLLTFGIIWALIMTITLLAGCSTTATTNTNTTTTSAGGSYIWLLVFIVIIFGLMYFFTIRPQRKKQQEMQKMLQSLQIGDNVITNGGIYDEWTEESEVKIPLYKGTTTYINQLSIVFDETGVVKNHRISEISAGSQRSIGETKTPQSN